MPKESHLYLPTAQAMLRAARNGKVKKFYPNAIEEEREPVEEEVADEPGFVVRKWALVPKVLEGPEPEYLAKRRKGLPSFYSGMTGPTGTPGQMRRTRVKKTDSEGNVSVWDVLVPEGQTVEGEILEEESMMTEAPAPGTVVEGVGVVNAEGVVIAGDQVLATPTRRRPPPSKRKGKGAAKGKRKRVGFVSISKGGPPAKPTGTHLAVASLGSTSAKPLSVSNVVTEPASNGTGGGDTPMQDGEEGPEEGSEDDEEGEEGEDNDREGGDISPSPSLSKSPFKTPAINISGPDIDSVHDVPALILSPHAESLPNGPPTNASPTNGPPPDRDLSSSPDLPLAVTQNLYHGQTPLIRIEPAEETILVPAPETIEDIPTPQHISVAEPPAPEITSANAQLPADHDLLDGLAAPTIPPPPSAPQQAEDDSILRFPDGDEDLLGSLERSLGRRGKGAASTG